MFIITFTRGSPARRKAMPSESIIPQARVVVFGRLPQFLGATFSLSVPGLESGTWLTGTVTQKKWCVLHSAHLVTVRMDETGQDVVVPLASVRLYNPHKVVGQVVALRGIGNLTCALRVSHVCQGTIRVEVLNRYMCRVHTTDVTEADLMNYPTSGRS